jgi:cytochrome c-type biogenesis protein
MGVLAADVTSNIYVLTAFGAGIISFLSPCVLPIVPGYLSLVTGVSVAELEDGDRHYLKHIAINTGLFVLGFTVVFVLLGLITTAVGSALLRNQETLTRVSGAVVLLMAAYLAGSQLLTTPRLYRDFRFHPHVERFGPAAATVTGAAFGLGWTPCIGPVLGAVLGFAARGEDLGRATLLLVAYSLGLGSSFLAVGLATGKLTRALKWFQRHARAITLFSAGVLAVFGVILLTDQLPEVTARVTNAMRDLGLGWLVDAG